MNCPHCNYLFTTLVVANDVDRTTICTHCKLPFSSRRSPSPDNFFDYNPEFKKSSDAPFCEPQFYKLKDCAICAVTENIPFFDTICKSCREKFEKGIRLFKKPV